MDGEILKDLVTREMPFGKFKGSKICNLPEFYLVWFKQQGFPKGKLGMWMETMYEIRVNGLEYLLDPLKRDQQD
ncbi:MAG: DUF3820 family protein [Bacteroidales bacterium]|nr:DUF3820 family protein [Bacteroidales bacterium]